MDWPLLAALHAAPTLCMTGLVWFVQVVHYPLFAAVGAADAATYEREHCRRTTLVVLPLMLAELALAGAVWWSAPRPAATLAWVGLAALAIAWVSTFAVQVPCHRRLSQGPDPAIVRLLVRTNWLRTAAWTARGAIAVALTAGAAAAQSSA